MPTNGEKLDELLVLTTRIDERTKHLETVTEQHETKITHLMGWKNKIVGMVVLVNTAFLSFLAYIGVSTDG